MNKRPMDHLFLAGPLCRVIVLSGGLLGPAIPAMAQDVLLQHPTAGLPGGIGADSLIGGPAGSGSQTDVSAEGPATRLPGAFTFTVPVQVTELVSTHASVVCRVRSSADLPGSPQLSASAPILLREGGYAGTVMVEVHNNRGYDPATLALLDSWTCSLSVAGSHEGEYQCTMGWCGLYEDTNAPVDIRVRPGAVTSVSGAFP